MSETATETESGHVCIECRSRPQETMWGQCQRCHDERVARVFGTDALAGDADATPTAEPEQNPEPAPETEPEPEPETEPEPEPAIEADSDGQTTLGGFGA